MPPSRRAHTVRDRLERNASRFPNNLRFSGTLAAIRRRPATCRRGLSEPSGDSVANQNRTGADPGDDEGTEPRRAERRMPTTPRPRRSIRNDIFASTGVVPYAWDVATDALIWGANARDVLEVRRRRADRQRRPLRAAGRSQGRALARSMPCMNSGMKDDGAGVPYEVQYALQADAGFRAAALDRGHRPLVRRRRRHAGARPRRRAGDRRAPRAGAAARLSLALRRAHRRDEPLAHDRGARSRPSRRRSSCAPPAASCSPRSTISAASTRPTASTSPTR